MKTSRRQILAGLSALAGSALLAPSSHATSFDLGRYKGQVVYLDFWASWCGPCLVSFPWLADMHDAYADAGLKIVAVNVDRKESDASRFLSKVRTPFDIVYDPKGNLAERFGVAGMPHSFLFARNGGQISNHIGFLAADMAEREKAIQAALAVKS